MPRLIPIWRTVWLCTTHSSPASGFLYGLDPGVAISISPLWHRGYPDQARRQSAATLALAHELSHPFSQGGPLFCGDAPAVLPGCSNGAHTCYRGLALCQTHGFAQFLAQAQVMHGWAVATQDQADAGLAQMHQGLIATRATGAEMPRPYFLGLLAETCAQHGQPEAGHRDRGRAGDDTQVRGVLV